VKSPIDWGECVFGSWVHPCCALDRLAVVFSEVRYSPFPEARGRLAAKLDLTSGHYEVLGYGLPGPARSEYVRLLQGRYGIHLRTIALCVVEPSLVTYANSYNEVSTAAANHKFGHDVFRECYEEAERQWKAKRDARPSSNRKSP
jgi:hypothetical protein